MNNNKNLEVESFQNENLEESEMGQLHAIHLHMNAVADIRSKIKTGPGLSHCEECGVEIPKKRRDAVPGVTMCVECQTYFENKK